MTASASAAGTKDGSKTAWMLPNPVTATGSSSAFTLPDFSGAFPAPEVEGCACDYVVEDGQRALEIRLLGSESGQ